MAVSRSRSKEGILSERSVAQIVQRVLGALAYEQIDWLSEQIFTSDVYLFNARLHIQGPMPELRFNESDQAAADNAYRIRAQALDLLFERQLTADWATSHEWLQYADGTGASTKFIRLASDRAADWDLRLVGGISGSALSLGSSTSSEKGFIAYTSSLGGSAVARLVITSNVDAASLTLTDILRISSNDIYRLERSGGDMVLELQDTNTATIGKGPRLDFSANATGLDDARIGVIHATIRDLAQATRDSRMDLDVWIGGTQTTVVQLDGETPYIWFGNAPVLIATQYLQMNEMTAPTAGAADTGRIFC